MERQPRKYRRDDNKAAVFYCSYSKSSICLFNKPMEFDLNKTLEALLLSTAEPITLKTLGEVFARYHREQAELSLIHI